MSQKKIIIPTPAQVRLFDPYAPLPCAGSTHLISHATVIHPPPGPARDRTRPDRERFMDRLRKKIKKTNIIDFIKDNDIFGYAVHEPGVSKKIKVPVDDGGEPRWRPGRDGSGGPGRGRKASDDEGDLVYIDMTYEEFLDLFFDALELPFLLKKDMATTLVKSHKRRGIQPVGPRARLNKRATAIARLRRAIAEVNAHPEDFADPEFIPGVDEVPFHKRDLRYDRIEERDDPDSKAVVFFLLDRSGSMMGDPLAIAKAFFLINLIFLRTKYKEVRVVMIAHDAAAHRIADEKNFYQIEVSGGTMFVPAYEMTLQIAETEFSSATWNRYMFHATDGYMFDGDQEVTDWWSKLVKSNFNYCGYLEIDPWAGRGRSSWAPGGAALLRLPDDVKAHVGMSRVSTIDELPDAFKEILDKDKKGA